MLARINTEKEGEGGRETDIHRYIHTDGQQRDGKKERNGQTDRQTDKQTGWQVDKQTDKNRQTTDAITRTIMSVYCRLY